MMVELGRPARSVVEINAPCCCVENLVSKIFLPRALKKMSREARLLEWKERFISFS